MKRCEREIKNNFSDLDYGTLAIASVPPTTRVWETLGRGTNSVKPMFSQASLSHARFGV